MSYKPSETVERYRHYKGKEYQIIGIATHTENEEKMVVYKALYAPYKIWVRPYVMFFESIQIDGKIIPRFEKIEDNPVAK